MNGMDEMDGNEKRRAHPLQAYYYYYYYLFNAYNLYCMLSIHICVCCLRHSHPPFRPYVVTTSMRENITYNFMQTETRDKRQYGRQILLSQRSLYASGTPGRIINFALHSSCTRSSASPMNHNIWIC